MKIDYIKLNNKVKIRLHSFGLKPRILLLSGIHGDEKTGVLILKSLVTRLRRTNKAYSVMVIPTVNPSAYAKDSRVNPKDRIDLNRIFPVKNNQRTESFKIASKLQQFAEQFEIIIDLHVFNKQKTLICGVDLNKNHKIQSKIRSIMAKLNLDAMCRIDHRNEPKKDGSLCGYLQSKNKIAFGIELPSKEILTKKQSKTMVSSLIKFIENSDSPGDRHLQTYIRQQYYLKDSGYFKPIKFPGERIGRGEVVGMLKKRKIESAIISPFRGKLISISYPRFIRKNEKIFVVGKLAK